MTEWRVEGVTVERGARRYGGTRVRKEKLISVHMHKGM